MVDLKSRKLGDFLSLTAGLLILVNINLAMSHFKIQFDLTGDKRHTISEPAKNLLKNLDDVVYIDVYLEGDFPPAFERLKNATRDMLNEFRVYGGRNLQFNFIDPDKSSGPAGKNDFIKYLGNLGIQPTNLYATENGKKTEKLIFPGAVISYGGREAEVMLLKGNKSSTPAERLNQSVESVEYELASGISKLVNIDRKRIAMIYGNGELESVNAESAITSLNEYYDVLKVNLPEKPDLNSYDAIIIAKPARPFNDNDVYKIDQYIMNGGKALFLLDEMQVNTDSISSEGTIGFPVSTNLEDLLFKYGIRINKDLILDLNSGYFPVVTGNLGNAPNFQLMQWPFFPLLNQFSDHPVVRNMDAIYSKYASSMDTVKAGGIAKSPLIFTSPYSRLVSSPVRISLNDLREQMKPQYFNHGPAMVSCLLEGEFISVFQYRFLPGGIDQKSFKSKSRRTRIIVCSDGDLIGNETDPRTGEPYELGYDPYSKATFANRDFLLNSISYLLDENGLIISRSREVVMRPLDKLKITEGKTKWQIINLLIPVILVVIFGITRGWIRKHRYSS